VTYAQTWDVSYDRTTRPLNSPAPKPAPPGSVPPDQVPSDPVPPAAGRHCQLDLTPGPEAAKAARDFTTATLRNWQLDTVVQEAVIIASELVTNAIRHGRCIVDDAEQALVGLAWQRHPSRVVCVVTDQSERPPVLAPADPDAESGRGLQVVQALAAAWGWMMLGAQEKAVWAALWLPKG
jgi:anti-sigma regulatory factor (Ser/Thr protein kinase)